MQLLHDVDIIQSLRTGYAPAYVLEAAGHVLLPVEVVGGEPGGTQGIVGVVQHGGYVLRRGDGQTLQQDAAALLQAEGVDGDVVRAEGQALVQRAAEALRCVGGQSGDEIHVHMGEAHGGGQRHGRLDVRRRVPAADGPQHRVLHGLGVDADAVGTVIQQHLQLLPGDGVGAACLDAVLRAARQIKALVQMGQQVIHLLRRQSGGRTAAHIEGLDAQTRLRHHAGGVGDLLLQRRQIRLHQAEGLLHRGGDKAAVGAAGGAERDAHIERYLVGQQRTLGRQSRTGRLNGQTAALRRDEVGVAQDAICLTLRSALLQHGTGQLAGADAGERPPAGGDAGDVPRRLEERQLQGALTQTLPLVLIGGVRKSSAGDAPRRFAVIVKGGDAGGIAAALRQGHEGAVILPGSGGLVDGALLRKEGQQALLNGVAIVVATELQLHCFAPCRM